MCLEDMASTESDELDCRLLDKSSQSSQNNNVSAITLATNLSVTLIIIVDQ